MSTTYAPLDEHRIRAPRGALPRAGGEFVLYWVQITMRAHDNFALQYAIERADELGIPVVVYQGLRRDYPWANDRLHTFVLESVADLYRDFDAKGIQYAFYLDTRAPGERGESESPLVALARRAALVVTDAYPTFLMPRQTRALAKKIEAPVIAVDSATLVPMAFHDRQHATARGFRPVLMAALPRYFHPVRPVSPRVRREIELPFSPVRPDARSIPRLVKSCHIDHAVPPAPAIRGGTAAGRARLGEFVATGLPRYAKDRNDPNDLDAVSRLSPYLHFGNVSIHEVLLAARQAASDENYDKFLDEALVWRELAHNFVHFDPKHRTVEAIPAWARAELEKCETDPRPWLYTQGELEQARTHDELWNAAQRAYVVDGWMHNVMRMLWGKAVLAWTPNAAECLRILEHLNNKYSLDGRDPNTYGGIHWTFGKFDRPFYRRPIYGTVRYQSLNAAKGKFDVKRYIASHPPV